MKGLDNKEVQERVNKGLINKIPDKTIKSVKDIVFSHVFTFFNALNVLLALLVVFTGQFKNMLFMITIITNCVIGIYNEVKAKKKLDELKFLSSPHATVIRNDNEVKVSSEDIVLDDLIKLKLGDEVLADATLIEGTITVNESLLTGEQDDIIKNINDTLFAGSYVTSGNAYCRVNAVGENTYLYHIIKNVSHSKRQPSKLRDALDFIIKNVSKIIIPLGIIFFVKQYFITHIELNEALLTTVASTVGMIPEGLVLLTSVALTVGVIKLANENTLVQEMFSLETFARLDVLCLDKTGTITTGNMTVENDIRYTDDDIDKIIYSICKVNGDTNPTNLCLLKHYHTDNIFECKEHQNFSSKTKSSSITTVDGNFFQIGAYEFIDCIKDNNVLETINEYSNNGYRVLALTKNKNLIALIIIADEIKHNAKEIFDYLKKQDVDLKIISGDDCRTVSSILNKIGLDSKAINCDNKTDDELKELVLNNNVFGRVTPDQKSLFIKTLKENNHVVGMIGDGVNDVMALKEADFSIAMASGADSAKNIANVVLLDNDFSHLPSIINEGRRVINNIVRTASLFLCKTLMSFVITLFSIFILKEYPFKPIQLTLIAFLCIGFPSFFLSLEPNYKKVSGSFLATVLKIAIPFSLTALLIDIILNVLLVVGFNIQESFNTIYSFVIALTMLLVINKIGGKKNKLKIALLCFAFVGFVLAYLFLNDLYALSILNLNEFVIVGILIIVSCLFFFLFNKFKLFNKLFDKIDNLY